MIDLGEFTNEIYEKQKKKRELHFNKEIADCSYNWLDKIHMEFLHDNGDLDFDDVLLVRDVFEYIKKHSSF